MGAAVIDTDAVYHSLVSGGSKCLLELVSAFGEGILNSDGSLNRPSLAAAVFQDREKHALLNSISHKHVLKKVREIIAELSEKGARAVLVDAPMLFESGFDKECDLTLGVIAPTEVRISRITERDGISRERALARISNQLSDREIEKRCDYVIYNGGEDILPRVSELSKLFLN